MPTTLRRGVAAIHPMSIVPSSPDVVVPFSLGLALFHRPVFSLSALLTYFVFPFSYLFTNFAYTSLTPKLMRFVLDHLLTSARSNMIASSSCACLQWPLRIKRYIMMECLLGTCFPFYIYLSSLSTFSVLESRVFVVGNWGQRASRDLCFDVVVKPSGLGHLPRECLTGICTPGHGFSLALAPSCLFVTSS